MLTSITPIRVDPITRALIRHLRKKGGQKVTIRKDNVMTETNRRKYNKRKSKWSDKATKQEMHQLLEAVKHSSTNTLISAR